jgi:hypothetical protein
MVLAVKFNVEPAQTGLLLPAVGATGIGLTTTVTVPAGLVAQPGTVAVTEYVPASATTTLPIVGFCVEELNAFGPVHEYVAPAIALAVRFNGVPAHTGLLLPAVGAEGGGLTITVTVPFGPVHPAFVTLTVYVPASANTELAMLGFCDDELKLFGPVQLYVAPAMVLAVRLIGFPKHTGLLLPAVGAAGVGLTTTVVVPVALPQPLTVTTNEYVPAAAKVALAIVGFCNEELKVFGPVQLYVAPATALVVKFNGVPVQTGLLLLGVGVVGVGLTTTVVVPAGLVAQPGTVTVTEYVPASATTTPAIDGFCVEELNAFGPVQLYIAPANVLEVRFKVVPEQTGLLLLAVGAAGGGLITTTVVATGLAHPATVKVTE